MQKYVVLPTFKKKKKINMLLVLLTKRIRFVSSIYWLTVLNANYRMSQLMVGLRRDVCQIMTASKHDGTLNYFTQLTKPPLIIHPFASRRSRYSLWSNFSIFYLSIFYKLSFMRETYLISCIMCLPDSRTWIILFEIFNIEKLSLVKRETIMFHAAIIMSK